jgi:outer membrane receptor protein involved in Fe transport
VPGTNLATRVRFCCSARECFTGLRFLAQGKLSVIKVGRHVPVNLLGYHASCFSAIQVLRNGPQAGRFTHAEIDLNPKAEFLKEFYRMSKLLRLTIVACLMVAMGAISAFAQSTVTGAIGGLVTDPNGAVLPNATVTARNTETNKEDTATSSSEGRFRIVNLQPGTYTVTINAQGFGTFTQEKLVVEVGRVTEINSQLAVGATNAGEVTVSSEAPVINTNQQDFSNNINQTSINELPINGRRWSNFALLTPGAAPDGNFGLISFRGVSGLLNNNTIDGGDNNQAFFAEERGRTRLSYSISQAAVREFQVNTSNYSAEYGRAAGGVVNAVTKSGTNEFHGSAFYYQRNNKWGARNPLATQTLFNASTGAISIVGIKPEDVRHQFGGTIGGPIVKDKLFFFFSYDQQKRNFPGLAIFSTPNYLLTPNVQSTPGTTLAQQQSFDRSLKNPRRNISDAQINSALSFLTSLTGPVPRRGDQKLFLPKIDWNINSKNTFTATYNRLRWESPAGIQTQPTNTLGRASFGDDFVNLDSLNLRLASTITPTLLNEARFQYGRDNEFEFSQPPTAGEPTTGFNGRSPDVFLTNGIEFGKPTFLERRAFPDEKRWQYADTMTWTHGNHTIKFGGDINHVHDILDNLRFEGGAYSYSNIDDFIIDYLNWKSPLANIPCSSTNPVRTAVNGTPAAATRFQGRCYTSNYQQAFGPTKFQFSTNDYNFFVQDDWRVSPRLTVNLGLRYEYEQLPTPQIPNAAVPQTFEFPSDKNNFGPRFGFAYALTNDGKTSVRGGYGIYYGRIINSTIANAITNTGNPAGQFQFSISGSSTSAPIFPNVLSSAAAGGTTAIQFFQHNYQNPTIHQADIIFEREIARNTVVSVSGLLSLGRYLPDFVDTNLNFPTTTRKLNFVDGPLAGQTAVIPFFNGARPNSAFNSMTEIQSDIKSEYEAIVFQLNRRLTNGLQFLANYTRSRARDTGQTSTTFTINNNPFNVFDRTSDNGVSNFDTPNKLTVSAVYNVHNFNVGSGKVGRNIFNGFTISPIFNWLSGAPYSGVISGASGGTQSGLNGSGGPARVPLLGRNSFRQPKIVNVDLRISRRFKFTETTNFEVLAEGFNIFNRTQVTGINNTMYRATASGNDLNLTYNQPFGTVTAAGATLFRERQIQLAVRFEF